MELVRGDRASSWEATEGRNEDSRTPWPGALLTSLSCIGDGCDRLQLTLYANQHLPSSFCVLGLAINTHVDLFNPPNNPMRQALLVL